jgi:hypothetical protein
MNTKIGDTVYSCISGNRRLGYPYNQPGISPTLYLVLVIDPRKKMILVEDPTRGKNMILESWTTHNPTP